MLHNLRKVGLAIFLCPPVVELFSSLFLFSVSPFRFDWIRDGLVVLLSSDFVSTEEVCVFECS